MRVEFGDVDEAQLSITNGRGTAWTFDRDGDELIVRSPDGVFGWWFGNWFGDEEIAVLTLPESLRGDALDADLNLDAGSLDVVGDFGVLDVRVNAGALDVEGSARELDAEMNAGRADILLDGVTRADLGVSAGDLTVELTGTAPLGDDDRGQCRDARSDRAGRRVRDHPGRQCRHIERQGRRGLQRAKDHRRVAVRGHRDHPSRPLNTVEGGDSPGSPPSIRIFRVSPVKSWRLTGL